MKRNKGFTLIELLVVIAIIGILTAIIMTSVNQARDKAKDSKIQSQLAGMRAAAEIYYSGNGNKYGVSTGSASCTTGLFGDADSGMQRLASSTPDIICGATDIEWAAAAPLISDVSQYWCVDNTGVSRQVTSFASFDLTDPFCPAS